MRVHCSDGAGTNLIYAKKLKTGLIQLALNPISAWDIQVSKSKFQIGTLPADPSLRHTVLRSSLVVEVGIYLSHSIIHPPCIVIKFCN